MNVAFHVGIMTAYRLQADKKMSLYYTDLNELQQDLGTLRDNMEEWAIEVLIQKAQLIQGYAQTYVRVNTGALRDSIRIERRGNTVSIIAGDATVNYAQIIEQRYPYMRPAFDQVEPQIPTALKNDVEARL